MPVAARADSGDEDYPEIEFLGPPEGEPARELEQAVALGAAKLLALAPFPVFNFVLRDRFVFGRRSTPHSAGGGAG